MKSLLICTFLAIMLIAILPATSATELLEINDASNVTYNFTYQQLAEMPKTTLYAELYCYGNLVASGDWSGVQLNFLLTKTNVNSEVKSIQLTASDSYIVVIPIQLAMAPETIIAYQKDGDPIPGLRLVLPGVNGASWITQIVSITMGNAEVDAPAAASGPGGRANLATNIIESRQPPPTSTITSDQTQPNPKPIGSQQNPTVSPTNITEVEPTPKQQTSENQSLTLDNETMIAIAAVIGISMAIVGFTTFKLKTKKDNPAVQKTN